MLKSIERLNVLEDYQLQIQRQWETINYTEPNQFGTLFSPRRDCLVAKFNTQQILIMGGNDGSFQNDIWTYDISMDILAQIDTFEPRTGESKIHFGFANEGNTTTQLKENQVVAFVESGHEDGFKSYFVKFKKGDKNFCYKAELPKRSQ